jgi:hypothetical protein
MNNIKRFLLAVLLPMIALPSMFAGGGKAIVPLIWIYKYDANNWNGGLIFLNNLTDHAVNVTITFYNKNGQTYPAAFMNYENLTNNNTQLAARSAAKIACIPNVSYQNDYGIAIIEWQNLAGDNDSVALLAHAHNCAHYGNGSEGNFTVAVNNNNPF